MKRNALVLSILAGALVVFVAGGLAPATTAYAGDEAAGSVQASPAPNALAPTARVLPEQKPAPALAELAEVELPPAGEAPAPFPPTTDTQQPTRIAQPQVRAPRVAVAGDFPAPPPSSFSSPAAVLPTTSQPVTVHAGTSTDGLPAGWQGHRPGQVVWSSEWGTPAPVAPAVSYPVETPVTFEGLPAPEDAAAPAASDGAPPAADRGAAMAERRAFLVQSYIEKAREALRMADVDGAKDMVTQALDLDPTNAEARELWQSVSLDRASTAGAYAGSRGDVATVQRERAATEVRNHLRRGQQNESSESYEEAVRDYSKALAIISWYDQTADFGTSSENIRDLIDAARAKARVSERRDRQEAIRRAQAEREAEMAQAREQRLGRVRAWFEGAHRAFRRGEYALAREFARQILRADPNNADAERIITMSHDAEHIDNECEFRSEFADQWKSIMMDLEEASLPQVDTVIFPENWLEDIAQRQPRAVGDPIDDADSSGEQAILSVLTKQRVQGLTWEEANLDTVVGYLRTITGLNFYVTPKVIEEKGEEVAVNLNVSDVAVATVLDLITQQYELAWQPRGGVVTILTKDEVRGSMKLRYFDVRDLAVQIRDFSTEDLNLVPSNFTPPEPPDLPEPEAIYSPDSLVELIQNTIGNEETWSESAPTTQNGIIIIRNTPEILAEVEDLLSQLRASTGVLVNLEVRFLTAEDNFLREVGVDIRGLNAAHSPEGGVVAPGGTPLRGLVMDDLRTNGLAFGADEPSVPGANGSRDAGIIWNDGANGAYSGRVENLFDAVALPFGIHNQPSLTGSGGFSGEYTLINTNFIGETALEVILRAVEKSERVQQITAPRLSVYNAQRANLSILNQISYVQDYEVEIAQASNIANPVVQTIQEGVVLDVRPIVSSDRRFVTLELRPTVATVLRPIPTITTNLASGPFPSAPVTLQVPEMRIQRVRTTVMMPDGATLLIGGMKYYDKDVRDSGVPFLSKIPVLSFLFTRRGNFVNRRNLLILVTARIVSLEELEPKDNLVLPPEPERFYRPIREIDPGCGPCMNGMCDVPPPQAEPACGCAPRAPKPTCTSCNARR
ncbi:MAG: hypothetical protein AB7T63_06525 [Planctomycetota bacterium]